VREGLSKTRAFTLIEIMLVVVLLGILAAVVIPMYWDSQTSTRIARAQADISVLNRQLAYYNARETKFNTKTSYDQAVAQLADAGYIKTDVEAPEGLEYFFDANLSKFSYSEKEEKEGKAGKEEKKDEKDKKKDTNKKDKKKGKKGKRGKKK